MEKHHPDKKGTCCQGHEFPTLTNGCESSTKKRANKEESMSLFEMKHWRKLLKVPWTTRKMNHLILNEVKPDSSLKALTVKPKYFRCTTQKQESSEKI